MCKVQNTSDGQMVIARQFIKSYQKSSKSPAKTLATKTLSALTAQSSALSSTSLTKSVFYHITIPQ